MMRIIIKLECGIKYKSLLTLQFVREENDFICRLMLYAIKVYC